MPEYMFLFGRQPDLSEVELKARLHIAGISASINRVHDRAALVAANELLPPDFIHSLGGTIRIGEVVVRLDHFPTDEDILAALTPLLDLPQPSKWKLGISQLPPIQPIQPLLRAVKKKAKVAHSRLAYVNKGKEPELNAAQVVFHRLTQKPNVEVWCIPSGSEYVLGYSTQVQDIAAYEGRDTARPARDQRAGMLPPKLAQMMVSIAVGAQPEKNPRILDPFCGTGVLLQEGWLLGYQMTGSDQSEKMIRATRENLNWLAQNFSMDEAIRPQLFIHDVNNSFDQKFFNSFQAIVTEPYLGSPLRAPLSPGAAGNEVEKLAPLYRNFFAHGRDVLQPGGVVCAAIPQFRTTRGWQALLPHIVDDIKQIGYDQEQLLGKGSLVYKRPDAFVARELVVFKKASLA